MKLRNIICLGLPPIILLVAGVFVFGIFLIKWFWGWTIPALFPLAANNDTKIIASVISWGTAFKLSLFISALVAGYHQTQSMNLKKLLFFCFCIILVKLFWGWTIPDLFPNGVAGNLVSETISWWSAIKLSILFTLLSAVSSFKMAPRQIIKK